MPLSRHCENMAVVWTTWWMLVSAADVDRAITRLLWTYTIISTCALCVALWTLSPSSVSGTTLARNWTWVGAAIGDRVLSIITLTILAKRCGAPTQKVPLPLLPPFPLLCANPDPCPRLHVVHKLVERRVAHVLHVIHKLSVVCLLLSRDCPLPGACPLLVNLGVHSLVYNTCLCRLDHTLSTRTHHQKKCCRR